MGKIATRIALARAITQRTGKPVKAGAGRVITKVWIDENVQQPAPAVELDIPTARRLASLLKELDQVQQGDLGTMERHETMYRLADEAKALGLKGRWNLLCNRTQCLAPNATWYNRGSHAFYCPDCADMLNNDSFNGRDAERLFGAGQKLCVLVSSEEDAANRHVSP